MPCAQNLLCINKAVGGWLKRTGLPNGLVTHYFNLWYAVMEAETQDAHDKVIAVLRKEAPPKLIAYFYLFFGLHYKILFYLLYPATTVLQFLLVLLS